MSDFFNEIIACYKLTVDFFFGFYIIPGTQMSLGFMILACIIFTALIYYILRGIR